MILSSPSAMHQFGEKLGKSLTPPALIELVGDVGVGKTTIAQGIAAGLGVKSPVTSPSFTISKRYPLPHYPNSELVHYDFYRLPDLGIMSEELSEAISGNHIVILEWAGLATDLLPAHTTVSISLQDDGSRQVVVTANPSQNTNESQNNG